MDTPPGPAPFPADGSTVRHIGTMRIPRAGGGPGEKERAQHMFERFTDRARRVVVLAQEEARMLSHNYIGTEHMLLGLLHEGDGIAARALGDAGLTLIGVRELVVEIVGTGKKPPSGHIPFTSRAKKILELSLREALQTGVEYIDTEHLLLGLIREGEGVGAQIVERIGGSLEAVRTLVVAREEQRERHEQRELEDEGITGQRRNPLRRYLQSSFGSSVAREAAAGSISVHLQAHVADPVLERPEQMRQLLAVLGRRNRNNALLVGPSGAGKTALARGAAQLLGVKRGGPAALAGAELMELDLLALRTGGERLVRRRYQSIVLIEDLDTLLPADDVSGGRMTLALAKLVDAEAPIVVTCTEQAHARLKESYPALAARFEAIEIGPADQAVTLEILKTLQSMMAEFHKVTIDDSALAAAVELGSQATGRVLPGAAVDVLDEAAARLAASTQPRADEQTAVLDDRAVRGTSDPPPAVA